jgi:hypothetical protein
MSKIIEAFLDLSTMSIVHMFKWLQYYEEVIRLPNGKSIRRHMSTRIEAFSDLSTNVYRTHVHVASVLSRSAVTPYIDILRVLAAASVHNNGTRKNRRKILPISLGMFLGTPLRFRSQYSRGLPLEAPNLLFSPLHPR